MSIELDVWSEHKINFGLFTEAIDFFESNTGKKIIHRSFSEKNELAQTQQIEHIQYFTDFARLELNFKSCNRIELTTNFAYCSQIKIYPKTINYWGKGFYTRDSRWMELMTKDFSNNLHWNEKLADEFTDNWRQFRKYCQEITQKLGGKKIVYIRDNFKMIDKFFRGESLQSGIEHELATGVSEFYELDLVEHFPDDFKKKYVWFYESLKNKMAD